MRSSLPRATDSQMFSEIYWGLRVRLSITSFPGPELQPNRILQHIPLSMHLDRCTSTTWVMPHVISKLKTLSCDGEMLTRRMLSLIDGKLRNSQVRWGELRQPNSYLLRYFDVQFQVHALRQVGGQLELGRLSGQILRTKQFFLTVRSQPRNVTTINP